MILAILLIVIILYCMLQVGICVALVINWYKMRGSERELDEEFSKLIRFRWYDDGEE
jgi:hypothetical protein